MSKSGTFKARWSVEPKRTDISYERRGDDMPLKVKHMIARALLRELRAQRESETNELHP